MQTNDYKIGDSVEHTVEELWMPKGATGVIKAIRDENLVCDTSNCGCENDKEIRKRCYLLLTHYNNITIHVHFDRFVGPFQTMRRDTYVETCVLVKIKLCNCLQCFDAHTEVCKAIHVQV